MTEIGGGPPILEARGISKRYPGVRALEGVNFVVRAGSIHAVMGENGAGKSTLMKIIAGEEHPTEGELWLRGQRVTFDGPRTARDAGVAMVHQELTIIPTISVAENLLLGRLPGRGIVNRNELRLQAHAGLDRIGAKIDVRREASSLSPGEAQQVEIARALLADPDVLVLDEPTSSLSEIESARLSDTLKVLRASGMAIIYITHRLRDALDLADEATVLRDGEVVRTFQRDQLSPQTLVRAMVGRAMSDAFPKTDAALGEPVLEVSALRLHDGSVPIDFEVRSGEILGLAGLVGSGRTETLRVIAGLDRRPGQVKVGAKLVRRASVAAAQAAGIGFVPEERKRDGIITTFSVGRIMTLSALARVSFLGIIRRVAELRTARELIARLGVTPDDPNRRIIDLSGGNQQKAVVGRAIADGPRVLLLDEPTRGVDVGAKAEVHRMIGSLVAEGVAVVMASSEMPEVLAVSDRILVFVEGSVVAEFHRDDATEEKLMAAMSRAHGNEGYEA